MAGTEHTSTEHTSTDSNTDNSTGGDPDLIDMLADDHRAVESLLQEVETSATSPEHRRQLADHVITELARVLVTEQRYLYPAVREFLPDGERVADRALADQAEVERVMAELENMSPAHARFELLLSTLTAAVRRHNQDMLTELLPRLGEAAPAADRRVLARKVLRAKEIAPTRPHPAEADRPPAGLVLDPGVPLVESVKSALHRQS